MNDWISRLQRRLTATQLLGSAPSPGTEATVRAVIEPYFSRDYYLESYPDVMASGQDPLTHYIKWGAKEGRRPCADFDPEAYIKCFSSSADNAFHDAILNGRFPMGWDAPIADQPLAGGFPSLGNPETAHGSSFRLLPPDDVALIAANMNQIWYRDRYPEAEIFGGTMAAYYLALGWVQGHDPSPTFSTRYYLQENEDVALTGMNPFLHYLKYGKNDKWRRSAKVIDAAVFETFSGPLAGDLADAVALDPMVGLPLNARIVTSPFDLGQPVRTALKQLRCDLGARPYAHVVLIPQVRMSGAARVAGIYATALADRVGADNILIVQTDGSAQEHPEWFPQDVRSYDLSRLLTLIDDKNLHPRVLFDLLRGVEAEAVHLFNSRLGWDTLEMLGRQLSQEVAVTAYLFTWEETADGRKVGYPIQWLRETIDYCHVIICDSEALAQHIRDRFALPATGAGAPVVALTPADLSAPEVFATRLHARAERGRSKKILWAGRLDRQKRPDILEKIARRMPDTQFEVYGRAVLDKAPQTLGSLRNVTLMGEYQDFDQVIARDYDAFLYTAQWDGTPTILLDVVSRGLPIVASAVGGIGDLINDGSGWAIHDIEDVDAYCNALIEAASDPAGALARARTAYDKARAAYAPAPYSQAVAEVLGHMADVGAALGSSVRAETGVTRPAEFLPLALETAR